MDKNSVKLLILSLFTPLLVIFKNSPKILFGLNVAIDLIASKWDEAWDLYAKKNPAAHKAAMAVTGTDEDETEALVRSLQAGSP